jgi:DNA-binding FadR family transcriptional regulator
MTFAAAGGFGDRASNHTAFVVDQLGQSIVAGEYPERTIIPLDPDICEMFNVSRTVVREAKKTLIAKGLLQSKAKVGTRVRPASEWNMFDTDVLRWHASLKNKGPFLDELFEIRLIIEPSAAAHVAGQANAADGKRLSQICADMEGAKNDLGFAVANLNFHKAILQMSGNRFLQSLGDLVHTAHFSIFVSEAQRNGNGEQEKRRESLIAGYRRLIEAVNAHDPEQARIAMHDVIKDTHIAVS